MSLTNKTLSGFFWAYLERFGMQVMQMVIFIILARVLAPEAFGLMGMLAVFIAVSQSLTDSGFGQALIQKKDTDEVDYSSVFYLNVAVSGLVYLLLYLSAPYISSFYNEPELIKLVRVLGLRFIIAAFSMVQITRLTKEVRFKELMLAKLPSTLIGGGAGIIAAYMDYGVWSLVIQQLTDTTAYSVQIWIQSRWCPKWVFDFERVKKLFNFGSKLMLSGILNALFQNIYEVVIGRFFSTAEVGYYTQANKLKQLPVQNISSALGRVIFPILSEIQDDDQRLKQAYKKIIRQIFLFISPVMFGAIVLAEPMFRFVLTEKWLPAVPYFQWLCIAGLFYPANAYNLNILKVKGRTDLILFLQVIKKVLIVLALLILVNYSVIVIVRFIAIFSIVAFFINSYYSGRFIRYSIMEQMIDIWKFLFLSVVMASIVWIIIYHIFDLSDIYTLIIGSLMCILLYSIPIYLFEQNIIKEIFQIFKKLR